MALVEDLLEASHHMAADALTEMVRTHAGAAGFLEADLYLVDYEQVSLVRLPAPGDEVVSLAIDSTMAGRAFISGELVATPVEGGERLWTILLDGGERLGVMGVTVAVADDATRRHCWALASAVALLVVAKRSYTDQQELCRRTRLPSLASELQLQMLPPLTFVDPRFVIAGVLEDAYDTGGDAFDYAVNGPVAHFAIFDAMGHGMHASLLAASVVVAYRSSRRRGLTLAETYVALDEVVVRQFGGEVFVTAQLGQLHVGTGEFTWVNAGHPAPLIVRGGRNVSTLECAPSLPLGMTGPVVELAASRLSRGERLLFFSDGVVDAKAPDGDPFGEGRLADTLQTASMAGVSPAETMRRLLLAVLGHQGSQLTDDASMVMVEWRSE
ncbi:MAG: PP2C family protein-serine/threonine phosphatase [Acidimicrobiales bacterium]